MSKKLSRKSSFFLRLGFRLLSAALIISIAFFFTTYLVGQDHQNINAQNQEYAALAQTSNSADEESPVSPSLQDSSYLMVDTANQQILLSYQAEEKRAPASTTKLLSGLVAMQNLKESDVVKVGDEVLMDESVLNLRPGDEITVENLLLGMYLLSANDAAAALAVKAGGSMDGFMQKMNDYAQKLGCSHSHFVNPHGLDDPEHYSTAGDLVKIGLAFLNTPGLTKYSKITSSTISWQRADSTKVSVTATNTNLLLGKYPGDEGLKTGTTTQARQCLVTYATRADGDEILALLGSSQRYSDTVTLLDKGYAKLRIMAASGNLSKNPGPDGFLQPFGSF